MKNILIKSTKHNDFCQETPTNQLKIIALLERTVPEDLKRFFLYPLKKVY